MALKFFLSLTRLQVDSRPIPRVPDGWAAVNTACNRRVGAAACSVVCVASRWFRQSGIAASHPRVAPAASHMKGLGYG